MSDYAGPFGNEDYKFVPREDIVYGHDQDDSGDIDLDGDDEDDSEDEANFDDGEDDC